MGNKPPSDYETIKALVEENNSITHIQNNIVNKKSIHIDLVKSHNKLKK